MARLIGPDEAVRVVYNKRTGLIKGQGYSVPLYTDQNLTTLADVLDLTGTPIANSTLVVDQYSKIPLFQYPNGVDVVYTSIDGAPATPLYARTDDRLDTIGAQAASNASAITAEQSARAAAITAAITAQAVTITDASGVGEISSAMRTRFLRNRGLAIGRRVDTIDFYQKMTDSVWWRSSLESQTVPDTTTKLHLMAGQALVTPVANVLAGGGSVVDSGVWTLGNNIDAMGGSYWQSTAAGATKTWTSPAGTTALGINSVTTTNGSLAKVTIDGDATRANLLPTAQSLVDAGTYANTILVANGGSLQPTDRVYLSYATVHSWSTSKMIATDLAPGAHTVVYTSLGYSPVAAPTANRAYISDFLYNSGQQLAASGTVPVSEPVSSALTAISAWEYALLIQPTGASQAYTIGNTHGSDTELSFDVYVNGVLTTLTDNTITVLTGDIGTAEIRRTSSLTHPYLNAGATKVADSEVWYRLTRDGIRIDNTITWAVGGLSTADYIMLPMPGARNTDGPRKFNRGDHLNNGSGTLTFTGFNGILDVPKSRSPAGWMWEQSGTLAAGVWCANPGSYLLASSPAYLQDRNGDVLKFYIARTYGGFQTENFQAGQSRTAKARYCFRVAPNIDTLMQV